MGETLEDGQNRVNELRRAFDIEDCSLVPYSYLDLTIGTPSDDFG